jgi:hypothetical protein
MTVRALQRSDGVSGSIGGDGNANGAAATPLLAD